MTGAQDSLLSSTLTLLLNAQLATERKLGSHDARLTALESKMKANGSTCSPTPSSRWIPRDLRKLTKLLEIIATVTRFLGPILMYLGPWLALVGAALWKWLLPYVGRLAGL